MATPTSIAPPTGRRPRRPLTRTALALGMAALLASAGVTALAGTAEAASTLGAAAAEKGRYFGAAVARTTWARPRTPRRSTPSSTR